MHNHRYAYLDGLRGIAAIFVLIRHTSSFWGFSPYRSYLAVDLFFILSGFVIAAAYDKKLGSKKLSFGDFFLIRTIRLYPVFALSLALCSMMLVAHMILKPHATPFTPQDVFIAIALTAFFIPSRLEGEMSLFPLNGPYWSLFFELAVNFLYAAVRPMLSTTALITTVIVSGLAVAAAAIAHGNLSVGDSWGTVSIASGFARATFGIFFGLLIHRKLETVVGIVRSKALPFVSIGVVSLVLASPSAGPLNPLVDIVCVVLLFPVCVIFASTEAHSKAETIMLALGASSYPIYVIHQPLAQIVSSVIGKSQSAYAPFSGIILVGSLIGLSLLIERIYDIPIRQWLTGKFLGDARNKSSNPIVDNLR